uniref:uncharacterized protein LOC105351375 n=1 Tax=Fragaria vesca subsp. vesca TaxID=101020 RepID=UPI0005C9D078|nr:PREDICTED: uncharacterized protein LOC105351375 [Fragaria vesca subsp. vesca]
MLRASADHIGLYTRQKSKSKKYRWSDLPCDMLRAIAERLPYVDLFRFCAVCKTWRDCATSGIQYAQILIRYRDYQGECGLEVVDFFTMQYHRIGNKIRRGHQLFGCCLHASKHGWLLFSKPQEKQPSATTTTFFLYNPLGKTIELPSLNMDGKLFDSRKEDVKVVATFSTSAIFVVSYTSSMRKDCVISTCNLNDEAAGWIIRNYSRPEDHELENLAYMDGVFHCVFNKGEQSLLFCTFNVESEDWDVTHYSDLSNLQCYNISRRPRKYYLVESGGELFFALYRLDSIDFTVRPGIHSSWHIYQFDRSQKNWTRVELGNRALLLCGTSSSILMSLHQGETSKKFAGEVLLYEYPWMSLYPFSYPDRIVPFFL